MLRSGACRISGEGLEKLPVALQPHSRWTETVRRGVTRDEVRAVEAVSFLTTPAKVVRIKSERQERQSQT